MDATNASKLCESHGATLLHYNPPGVARLAFRSREQIMISIGTASAKLFRPSRLFGWLFPRCCASKSLAEWDPRYTQFDAFHRNISRGMALDGLLDLVTRADSISELRLAWCAIRNPFEVASVGTIPTDVPRCALSGRNNPGLTVKDQNPSRPSLEELTY